VIIELDGEWDQMAHDDSNSVSAGESGDVVGAIGICNLYLWLYRTTKGVMVEHASVVNHNLFVREQFHLSPHDRVLQFASYCFDASVEEIFPTLSSGSTLVLRSEEIPSVEKMSEAILRDRITVLNLPTAYWDLWNISIGDEFLEQSDLRLVVIGGEKVSVESLRAWNRNLQSRCQWINTYGPTEATVSCTAFLDDDKVTCISDVPIGRRSRTRGSTY